MSIVSNNSIAKPTKQALIPTELQLEKEGQGDPSAPPQGREDDKDHHHRKHSSQNIVVHAQFFCNEPNRI